MVANEAQGAERKFLTAEAAKFCTEHGRPVSRRTLQKYRQRICGTERGPHFYRDTLTGFSLYFESDLRAWIAEFDSRLVGRGPAARPIHLRAKA